MRLVSGKLAELLVVSLEAGPEQPPAVAIRATSLRPFVCSCPALRDPIGFIGRLDCPAHPLYTGLSNGCCKIRCDIHVEDIGMVPDKAAVRFK